MPREATRPSRAAAIGAVALVTLIAFAGCLEPPRDHPPRGDNAVRAAAVSPYSIDMKEMRVEAILQAPDGEHEMVWDIRNGVWENQTFHLPHRHEDDTAPLTFNLDYRVDGPMPVRLSLNETLERRHSFTFTMAGVLPGSGARVDGVANVDANASWVDAQTWDPSWGHGSYRLHAEFSVNCVEGCPDDGETIPLTLDAHIMKAKEAARKD